MNLKRDHFFLWLDGFLSRSTAVIPYDLAYRSLIIKLSSYPEAKSWKRNSILFGNFVFGISDLDVTILIPKVTLQTNFIKFTNDLRDVKKMFPFFGEANVYLAEEISFFGPTMNYFERKRDPQLSVLMPDHSDENLSVEKVVFLLRMLYSDRYKLSIYPELRQKKWKSHFDELELIQGEKITHQEVFAAITTLLDLPSDKSRKLHTMLLNTPWTQIQEDQVLKMELHEYWKFLYPHKHFWFKHNREENLAEIKDTMLEKICLRQLDWEIWGLFSQIPFILGDKRGVFDHLDRLLKVSHELRPENPFRERALRLIHLMRSF